MNLKKCLITTSGWSFIEYAMVFVVITAVVVGFIQSTLSDTGLIRGAFRSKTDYYIGKARN